MHSGEYTVYMKGKVPPVYVFTEATDVGLFRASLFTHIFKLLTTSDKLLFTFFYVHVWGDSKKNKEM